MCCVLIGLWGPDSRVLISFKIADINSSKVHSVLLFSLAKFLQMSSVSLPSMIGTNISPYELSDFPSDDKPLVWLSIVS